MIAQGKNICNALKMSYESPDAVATKPSKVLQDKDLDLSGWVNLEHEYPARTKENLTALMWFLMSEALTKKQGFEEGAFIVEDKNNMVHEYMSGFSDVYRRPSSHFKGRAPDLQLGVDIPSGKLPASKRTILFEAIDNPGYADLPKKVLFIKPENYSAAWTKPYDAGMHGYEFVEAQYNKVVHPGSDDLPNMRKERIPKAELNEFSKLVSALESSGDNNLLNAIFAGKDPGPLAGKLSFENVKKMAGLYGIAFMHRFLDNVDRYQNEGKPLPANYNDSALRTMLATYDHVEKRTGREVYIDNL